MENEDIDEDVVTEDQVQNTVCSDADFDDDLDVPESLVVEDVDGGQLEIIQQIHDTCNESFIPFIAIHKPPVKFKSFRREIFIPHVEIGVTIVDYERNLTTHLLNPNLYTISFTHGSFSWQVKKRYKHINDLHQQLSLYRASLKIPFPSKTHKKKRESFRNNTPKSPNGKKRGGLPRFPIKPEMLVLHEQLNNRIKQLEDYLYNLLCINIYRNHPATIEFLEVSHLSFIRDLGMKGKEGLVKKKTGSTQPGQSGCNCFGLCTALCCLRCKHFCNDIMCSMWRARWFFIKDTFIGYINPQSGRVAGIILFDQGFEVASGMYSKGLHKGMQIVTMTRQIFIKCKTRSQRKAWVEALKYVAQNTAKDFTQLNPHHSFAPIRNNIDACWFVDGAGYMSAVADALQGAKEEIFIADWWLSPEIYLKRPALEGNYWRLDSLLQRKAQEGVKIFILLYKEFEMALGLNSFYTKQKLSSDNIKILRHPDHAKVGVFLWAHHEKIVVIDQTYAFLGGVDLCYGRWDDYEHRLTDLGSVTPIVDVSTLRKRTSTLPSGDAFYPIPTPAYKLTPQPEIAIAEENEDDNSSTSSNTIPQLQPGDFLLLPQNNSANISLNTPELERKNKLLSIKTVKMKGKELMNMMYFQHENSVDVQKVEQFEDNDDLTGCAKYWIGKDYCNFIVKDFSDLDSPLADFIDRVSTPRMPWHDVALCIKGTAARDVSRHFIQRWNATKLEKARINTSYPYLLPKAYYDCTSKGFLNLDGYKVTCQVLRSVSTWSCGFLEPDAVEQSIHEGYIDAITRAQHYIYIENQFFISLPQDNSNTRNLIAETLYKRILRAHKEGAVFRVYVVLPLLPGFEGEVGGPTGISLHAITHWNYASISRGKHALLNRLKAAGIEDPSNYISFYGLRTHSVLNGEPITELIYVHSKLMIVDDKIVICGSANINDRSMIGKRDSEIAVFIEDEQFEEGMMNGEHFPSGKYAGSLRRQIFKEHLGLIGRENELIDFDVTDPISETFYREKWYGTASLNTQFYDKVFHCIPSDSVETFNQLKEYIMEKPLYHTEIGRSEQMLDTIQGHLVLFPLKFLAKEKLTVPALTVEGMMPTALWT